MNVHNDRKIQELVTQEGLCFIPSYLPEQETPTALRALGEIEEVAGIREIQELRPREISNSPPNIYSGNFGTGEFPFHTDLAHWSIPPRYLAQRCIIGHTSVATRVTDSENIVKQLGENFLRRTLVQPRRPLNGFRGMFRILEKLPLGRSRFRWDDIFIKPATASSESAFNEIKTCISSSEPQNYVLLNPGDTLILDNWRILHARSPVPPEASQRLIHRAYLTSLHGLK